MRRPLLTLTAAALGLSLGCGDGDKPLPPLTDEQKKAIQAEDRKTELEEGGGKPQRAGGKPAKR